ncbi:MAG: response regulator transcription factor [Theionarchaea archaeon]|nr:response regulator transcription factor [Theionarchaea archaeon]
MSSKFSDDELLELYCQGLTNRQIADRLQVTHSSVHYRLGRLGLRNNCRRNLFMDLQQVKILHGMGLTNIGIALLLKVSVQAVSQHMKEMELRDNYYRLKEVVRQNRKERG